MRNQDKTVLGFVSLHRVLALALAILAMIAVGACSTTDEPVENEVSALVATADDEVLATAAAVQESAADVEIQDASCECLQEFNDCWPPGSETVDVGFCLGMFWSCCDRCDNGQGC